MTGQSESEPMTIPTRAPAAITLSVRPSAPRLTPRAHHRGRRSAAASGVRPASRRAAAPPRRRARRRTSARSSPDDVDVAELAARTHLLAVQVHLRGRVGRRDGRERVGRGRSACCPARSPSRSSAPRALVSPSGRSSTARRCCSNWLVTAPSMVQWPELCGRIASSLTHDVGRRPRTARPRARRSRRGRRRSGRRRRPRAPRSAGSRSGAGAMTSAQTPSRWIDSTTGQVRTSPDGRRATSTASSRRNGTFSSASSGTPGRPPRRRTSRRPRRAERTTRTPLPS